MISATTTTLGNGDLSWTNEGYYTFGNSNWTDISITANFNYTSGGIGLLPRFYSSDAYVVFIVSNDTVTGSGGPTTTTGTASLAVHLFDQDIILSKVNNLTALVATNSYILKVDIKGTNFKAYLNGILLINAEYGAISSGSAALYSTASNTCQLVKASSLVPDAWTTNELSVNGAIIQIQQLSDDNKYIHMENPNGITELYIRQQVTVLSSQQYTLSCSYKGAVTLKVIETNGAALVAHTQVLTPVMDWTTAMLTVTIPSDCTQVNIQFSPTTTTPIDLNNTQFENSAFKTDYIHNISLTTSANRLVSGITYPSLKHIVPDFGAVSMWIQPSINYTTASAFSCILFEYGANLSNCIRLGYNTGILYFTYGATTINTTIDLSTGIWYNIVANWSGSNIDVYINNVANSVSGIYALPSTGPSIYLGYSSNVSLPVFNGIFDEFIIFSKPISVSMVDDIFHATTAMDKLDQITLHSTFDYEISNFDSSVMEITPAPVYGSPVIAVKEDSTVMRKVSYYDEDTNEFRPYNTEKIIYDGKSDFIEVGSSNIDNTNFKIQLRDGNGNLIGDPYTIDHRRINIVFNDTQKQALRGQTLYLTYQPKDVYTVDFNIGVVDSFRVNLGKHDGQSVNVTYEGNKTSLDKLASMIELNPLLSPHHEGFLYIAKTGQDTSNFKVKAFPDDLQADGISESVIIIEPVDSLGNFISNAMLTVTANRGSIIPNYDVGSINLRQTAGRYIYRYRAPLIYYSDYSLPELNESINVIDSKTGLGVQIPIILTLSDTYSSQGTVTVEQSNWETVAAFILDKIMANFGSKASTLSSGLGSLLDLNGDGNIDLQDIIWLNQYKLTQTLYTKYINLVIWYQNNS
jgi:hypothetical protein